MKIILVLGILGTFFCSRIAIAVPARADEINQNLVQINVQEPVPKDYKAYALFLFPSTEWREKNKHADLQLLHKKFKDFGEAIGDKNAAVWFKGHSSTTVDVERSKFYCRKFNLSYNDGPYVLVSKKRPDYLKSDDEIVAIKLSNISTSKIVPILNTLEQDLLINQKINRRKLLFEEIKQRIFTVVEHIDVEFNLGVVTVKPK
jgi:hypothetical protein